MSQRHPRTAHWGHFDSTGVVFFGQPISVLTAEKSGGHNYKRQWEGKCWLWEEKWGVISLIFLICGSPSSLRGYSISPDKSRNDIPLTQTATHHYMHYLCFVSLSGLFYFQTKEGHSTSLLLHSQVDFCCKTPHLHSEYFLYYVISFLLFFQQR